MSQETLEIVRAVFDQRSEGDFKTSFDLLDEHVVFVLRPEFPDAGTYVGPESIRAYTRGFLEPWTHLTMEAEELLDAGDTVVVGLRQRGVGDASGVPTELHYFQLWTFRGGKVIRLENIRERDEALEAAGLRDWKSNVRPAGSGS
jgi:ketosteroid isomerase-like protein